MKRKRRSRWRKQEEESDAGVRPQQETEVDNLSAAHLAQAGKDLLNQSHKTTPLAETAMLQMQEQHGNAYVQDFVNSLAPDTAVPPIQRAEEDAEPEMAADDTKPIYEFETDLTLREGGWLDIDLKDALDLKNLDETADNELQNSIKEWLGVGAVGLNDVEFNAENLHMSTDGRLSINLGESFLSEVMEAAVTEAGDQTEVDRAHLLGKANMNVSASLHFNAQDADIEDADLENKHKLLGNEDNRSGVFLLLKFEAADSTLLTDSAHKYLEGLFLFEAEF